ncbi:MAG: hypothetical protein JNM20_16165 [Rhizobiales bacterium]|nr:hypothetical protein [Hyphomicrobiales bacterium]
MSKFNFIAAAFLSVVALPLAIGSAQAHQCKSGYSEAEAIGNTRFAAMKNARDIWTAQVKNRYSLEWSVWNIAASKDTNCGFTGAKQYCIVKAKPCKYVVQ